MDYITVCTVQVVMAVAQLYHHCAPSSEINIVAKALIRLLREHKLVDTLCTLFGFSLIVNRIRAFILNVTTEI